MEKWIILQEGFYELFELFVFGHETVSSLESVLSAVNLSRLQLPSFMKAQVSFPQGVSV